MNNVIIDYTKAIGIDVAREIYLNSPFPVAGGYIGKKEFFQNCIKNSVSPAPKKGSKSTH